MTTITISQRTVAESMAFLGITGIFGSIIAWCMTQWQDQCQEHLAPLTFRIEISVLFLSIYLIVVSLIFLVGEEA